MNKRKKVVLIIIISVLAIAVIILLGLFLLNNNKKIKKIPFNEVKAELENFEFKEYSNLNFNCKPLTFDADAAYELVLEPKKEAGDKELQQLKNMLEDFRNIEVNEDDLTFVYGCAYVDNLPGTQIGGLVFPDNIFTISDYENAECTYSNHRTIKKINAFSDDYSQDYITNDDEKVYVKDAVKYASDYIDKYLNQYLNDGEDLALSDIILGEETETGGQYCVLHYHYRHEGILVNDAGFLSLDTPYLEGTFLEILISHNNEIETINSRIYYTVSETKKVDYLIPLSNATDILAEELAPYNTYGVSEVALKYVSVVNYGDENRVKKPMWCYTLQEYDYDGALFFPCLTACVDAQTGEVYLYDMKNSMMLQ